jgi:hypothetical protein
VLVVTADLIVAMKAQTMVAAAVTAPLAVTVVGFITATEL